jgi:hypothetical protein
MQIKEGLADPSLFMSLDFKLKKLQEALVVKRDFDLLQLCETLDKKGMFTHEIASLVLFDAYRGNFAEA